MLAFLVDASQKSTQIAHVTDEAEIEWNGDGLLLLGYDGPKKAIMKMSTFLMFCHGALMFYGFSMY